MEPQQHQQQQHQQQHALQPDQPDDDPDQDADQPPPQQSPTLLDNPLSLVAQPLASAAARVAASHSLPLPLDDLNDFNVDLSWAAPDIDSLFLNDTQYLQLPDDHPPTTPTPVPPTPLSTEQQQQQQQQQRQQQQKPSESATGTATITHPIPDSQQHPQPTTTTQNDPPPPPHRARSSTVAQKRSRPRPNQLPPKQNPIPIAPRTLNNPKHLPDLKIKSSPSTPRSTQAQSSALYTTRPKSAPLIQSPDRSPASVSRETGLPQNAPNHVPHFPLQVPHHTMLPLMNMYPLQHQQSVFQPSPSVLSPTEPNTSDSKVAHPPIPSNPPDTNNTRLSDPQPPTSAPQHPSQHHPVAQQQFLSPTMQVMPQGVVSCDAGMMPFFQMAYAAATAGYPQGIIPPIPPGSTNVPSTILNPFGPNRAQSAQHNNPQNVPATPADASTINHTAQQPPRPNSKSPAAPVLVHDGGTQILVPQQKAARLERHPVLGRLQLKSSSKPQEVAASSGMRFVSETQTPSGDSQQKGFPGTTPGAVSISRPGSASLSSRDGGQKQQKKRLVWTPELHDRFVKAISAVGLSQAVPKTLVNIMNVEGLTTEHVKSHLQKYRNSLRKEAAEEERDRSRGAGPSTGPHNIKLGTPGASGASVIHSVAIVTPPGSGATQNGRAGGATVTKFGGPQRLPVLPSCINAFGNQIQGVIQPTLDAKVSTKATKEMGAPQAEQAVLESKQGRVGCRSPRLGSMGDPKGADDVKGIASGTGTATQPSQAVRRTPEGSERDGMKVEIDVVADVVANVVGGENVKDMEQGAVEGGGDTEGGGDEVDVSQKGGSDSQAGQDLSGDGVKESEKDGNAGSESQSNRDVELDVMKETTQQMQLQVQMMIYRTIALEKKMEELHSERLNVEASGTGDGGDASKRSTVGDANGSGGDRGDYEMRSKDEGTGSSNKGGGGDGDKDRDDERKEDDKEKGGTGKKRRYGSDGNKKSQSELKALLNEQMGLQKRIEDGLAMIDKRMRREGE